VSILIEPIFPGTDHRVAEALRTPDEIQAYINRRLAAAFQGRSLAEVNARDVLQCVLGLRAFLEGLGVVPPLDPGLVVVVEWNPVTRAMVVGVKPKE
jgi:hypothetical protein